MFTPLLAVEGHLIHPPDVVASIESRKRAGIYSSDQYITVSPPMLMYWIGSAKPLLWLIFFHVFATEHPINPYPGHIIHL